MASGSKPILVVKIGTSSLLGDHEAPSAAFGRVASDISRLEDKYRVILVTSGAIGFGVRALGLDGRPAETDQLQALAMIGQVGLLGQWRKAFEGVTIGQVLVTRHDLAHADARQAFRRSVEALWSYGCVPVVNENDAVSSEEITFGDNDRLAAEIAVSMKASVLVLLTDQDGIRANFGTDDEHRIDKLSVVEADLHLKPSKSELGKGGAESKMLAARIALAGECDVCIGSIRAASIAEIISGQAGTRVVQ